MKRLIIAVTAIALSTGVQAQDAANKDVQAGLVIGYGMNFQKMGTTYLEANGVGSDLTIGANVNFKLTETIGFNTGIEFDFETLKYSVPAGDSVFYAYNSSDKNLIRVESLEDFANTEIFDGSENVFMLNSRKQKPLYVTIPTMLTFGTKYIGYFRYYGKFGLRTSILVSNKFTDSGTNFDSNAGTITQEEISELKAKNEMFPIKSAVGIAGGAEWNFIGSTVLAAEIGYYYGFTPLYNKRSFMWNAGGPNNTDPNDLPQLFGNKATQSQLMFKVSILF